LLEIIKDIEAMLYTFIWKSSVNRVKKDIVQKKYQEGGLKMINIHNFRNINIEIDSQNSKSSFSPGEISVFT
jgi:hypothetical protein